MKEWMVHPLFRFEGEEGPGRLIKKEQVEKKTEKLLEPILAKHHLELVDLEYGKEGSDQILRVTLDKEGGLHIDDCELVSRALSDALDKADFLQEAYMLEVSSPGLLRPIKKEKDFQRNMGKEIELHLYKAWEGSKEWIGILKNYDKDSVWIEMDGKEISFSLQDISLMRPYIDFSDL